MPTYQYACTSCEERLEVVQKFTDDPLSRCPECGGRLRKLFSPVGIVFKGSGFYRNDSRGSSAKPAMDKQLNGSAPDPSTAGDKAARADSASPAEGSPSSPGQAKPEKKASKASSGGSSSAGAKVA